MKVRLLMAFLLSPSSKCLPVSMFLLMKMKVASLIVTGNNSDGEICVS